MLLVSLALMALHAPLGAGEQTVVLTSEGAPRAALVIPEHPHDDQVLAARELQEHLRKMSGALLAIHRGETPADMLTVRIGLPLSPRLHTQNQRRPRHYRITPRH